MTRSLPTTTPDEREAQPSIPSRVTSRPFALNVAEWALYVMVALLLMWPVPLHFGSSVAGNGDVHYYLWLTWAVGQMIRHGHLALHIPNVIWPFGSDVRLLDGQVPTLIGGLWQAVVGSPYVAFNLALMTGTLLNIWAGRRLGKLFTDRRAVWIITALAFATAPAIATRMRAHFTLYFAFAVALLVEEAVKVARGDRPVKPVRLGLLLFLAYLCSIYYLVFGAMAFFLIVALSGRTQVSSFPKAVARMAAGAALALVLLLPFLLPRLQLERTNREHGANTVLLRNTFLSEPDVLSIVTQPKHAWLQLPGQAFLRRNFRDQGGAETDAFPGYLLLLGGIGGLALLRLPLRRSLLATTLILWMFALGTSPKLDGKFAFVTASGQPVAYMPYAALMHLPGMGSLRTPVRVSFTIAAVLAVPFALSLEWLFARAKEAWQRWAVGGVAVALLVTNLLLPIGVTRLFGSPGVHRGLEAVAARARPGDTMLTVPTDCRSDKLLWSVDLQILHRTPLVGCQASLAAIPWQEALDVYGGSAALASLRCAPGFLGPFTVPFTRQDAFRRADLGQLRKQLGVRFILVARWALRAPACGWLAPAVAKLQRFDVLGADKDWMVIDTRPRRGNATAMG